MFPRKLYPGQGLTATETNNLQRVVHRQASATGSGETTVADNPSGRTFRDNAPERIYGRISGAPTGSVYPWVEVAYDGSAWVDTDGWPGRSGTAASGGAKELAGRTDVPTGAIVQLTPLPGGGGWGFGGGSVGIVTANVDTTEESTTTRLEFDQDTGIRVDAGATDADPDVVSLDLSELFTESVDVLTQGCIELTVTKTYSTNPGETHLLTNVAVSAALVFKKRTLGLLDGTTVGAETCVAAETTCCVPGPTFTGCARQFPGTVYVTMSGPSGTCGCFTGTITLEWDAGYGAAGGYTGTFMGCTGTVTVVVYPDANPPTTWNVVWSAGSYTFDSGTVSQSWAFACSAISSGTLTQTVVAGCSGSFSFSVGE